MVKCKLYLGSDIAGKGSVSDLNFKRFRMLYVDTRFPTYTLLTGVGCWHGQYETCWIIEVISEDKMTIVELMTDISFIYKKDFAQECCLITVEEIETYTV